MFCTHNKSAMLCVVYDSLVNLSVPSLMTHGFHHNDEKETVRPLFVFRYLDCATL